MADFNFPLTPTLGQEHIEGNTTYVWNGHGWAIQIIEVESPAAVFPMDALSYNGMQVNGSFEVSQENGTTAVVGGGSHICDNWRQDSNGTMAISGGIASNMFGGRSYGYVVVTTPEEPLLDTSYLMLIQQIEGYRISRLRWGTPNAAPLTIGFWCSHNPAGTYSLVFRNGVAARSYATTYQQNVAGAAEYKTITVPGDTAGGWSIDNSIGLGVVFGAGCGSMHTAPVANAWLDGNYVAAPGQVNVAAAANNALRITGVIVLPGIVAPTAEQSPLIMRPYDQEIITCKRYFRTAVPESIGTAVAGVGMIMNVRHEGMRATPTVASVNPLTVTNGTTNIAQTTAAVQIMSGFADHGMYGFGNIAVTPGLLYQVTLIGAPIVKLMARL